MNIKLKNLLTVLTENYKTTRFPLQTFKLHHQIRTSIVTEIEAIFLQLGGKGDFLNIPIPEYHLEFENFALMLHEEKSFNRYRFTTLTSPLYTELPLFPVEKFKSYCRGFEKECLKGGQAGQNWTSKESEGYFGKSNDSGDLSFQGSAQWKLKAFQEFLLDITPLLVQVNIVHLSIWDNILFNKNMYRLNDLLLSSRTDYKSALLKFLERKISESVKIHNRETGHEK